MARRFKIVTVCGAGMGTGLLARMTVEKIAKKLGYEVSVEVVDLGSAAGMEADIYVTTEALVKSLRVRPDKEVVSVTNLFREAEIETKLTPVLKKLAESG